MGSHCHCFLQRNVWAPALHKGLFPKAETFRFWILKEARSDLHYTTGGSVLGYHAQLDLQFHELRNA